MGHICTYESPMVHAHNMKLLVTVPAVYIPSNAAQRKPGRNELELVDNFTQTDVCHVCHIMLGYKVTGSKCKLVFGREDWLVSKLKQTTSK